ncbi:MAG: Uncharacterized protein G01um10147_86 [Microgenomates group bacterium Gr01-1014_7]|nr:MAG: Uncharacterized protein G01um10147_86 [Microgenomates group bacterium Gr01-1014_7]
MWHKIHKWFIPHRDTHKKAHLISWEALLIYVLFFMALQVGFSIVGFVKPGILGISGNIDQKRLIELTNKERQNKGLPAVSENEALDKAATLKAKNMFEENYWAHFAPSGKTPWDFILGAGYKFTFAGENLAKNFYSSDEVVKAWVESPTHRDNLLNPNYRDIGIAVVEGVLNGQKTTLVVQEFGTTEYLAQKPSVTVQGKSVAVPPQDFFNKPQLAVSTIETTVAKSLFDPFKVSKIAGYSITAMIAVLLILDICVLRRRGVFRLSSHHIAHMALLSLTAGSLFLASPGAVL